MRMIVAMTALMMALPAQAQEDLSPNDTMLRSLGLSLLAAEICGDRLTNSDMLGVSVTEQTFDIGRKTDMPFAKVLFEAGKWMQRGRDLSKDPERKRSLCIWANDLSEAFRIVFDNEIKELRNE